MYFQYADPFMFDEKSQSRNNCLIFSKYLDNMFVAVNFVLKYNMHSEMSSNVKCLILFMKWTHFMCQCLDQETKWPAHWLLTPPHPAPNYHHDGSSFAVLGIWQLQRYMVCTLLCLDSFAQQFICKDKVLDLTLREVEEKKGQMFWSKG